MAAAEEEDKCDKDVTQAHTGKNAAKNSSSSVSEAVVVDLTVEEFSSSIEFWEMWMWMWMCALLSLSHQGLRTARWKKNKVVVYC